MALSIKLKLWQRVLLLSLAGVIVGAGCLLPRRMVNCLTINKYVG